MDDLTESFIPFWKKIWQEYKIEIFFLSISILTIISSIVILLINLRTEEKTGSDIFSQKINGQLSVEKIFVDVAGAVEKPDAFEVSSGARLKDVLISAGGLSVNADRSFFARNFNLARLLTDQEKIYITSKIEVATGIITENVEKQISPPNINDDKTNVDLININTASLEELDTLPSVGKVTAEKIIRGRPYSSVDELSTNKIVSKSVYDKIKNLITIN